MMRKTIVLLAVAAMAGSAFAANLDEGTSELSLNGHVNNNTALGTDVELGVGYGYFIADDLMLGVALSVSDNDAVTVWGLGFLGEYNFELGSPFVPYIGSGLGIGYTDLDDGDSNNAFEAAFYAGGKYFLTEDLAIDTKLLFLIASEDIYVDDDELEDTNWQLVLGLRYYFDL